MRPVQILPYVVAAWCGSSIASAQQVALSIEARSPELARCFDAATLQQRIAHYRKGDNARAAELRLTLTVDGQDTADLQLFRGDALVSRRRFEQLPQACTDRRDAVALSIALALEGEAREDTTLAAEATLASGASASAYAASRDARATEPQKTEARPASEPELPAPQSVPQPSAAETTPAGPRDSGADAPEAEASRATGTGMAVHLHVGARGLVEALPAAVWTGVLGAELWLTRRISIDLSAIASTLGNSAFAQGSVESRLVGGELFGCATWKIGSFATQGCLGASAAACTARGEGYPTPHPSATLPWVASAARLGLRWPDEDWLSLRLILQAHVNLVRPEFHVDGSSEQLSPSWVGGSGGLDMIVAFE